MTGVTPNWAPFWKSVKAFVILMGITVGSGVSPARLSDADTGVRLARSAVVGLWIYTGLDGRHVMGMIDFAILAAVAPEIGHPGYAHSRHSRASVRLWDCNISKAHAKGAGISFNGYSSSLEFSHSSFQSRRGRFRPMSVLGKVHQFTNGTLRTLDTDGHAIERRLALPFSTWVIF